MKPSAPKKQPTVEKRKLDRKVSTWQKAEEYVHQQVGGRKGKSITVTINNEPKARIIDVLDENGIAHEVKYGYVSKSKFVREQIAKDIELMKREDIRGVTWHFLRSEQTGKMGPSKPLLDYLQENGINVVFHE